jgi:Uma2 family endonuclease
MVILEETVAVEDADARSKTNDRIAPSLAEHSIVLREVSWETYLSLRTPELNNHLRMTFDHGELEIMSPSKQHEQVSYLIGRMVDEWTDSHNLEIHGGRSTTFSRKDLDRGLEPDNCYWIANESRVREQDEVDLSVDPPPDLALEVDVTTSWIPKLPIYRTLGVPEVWRWQNESLEIVVLGALQEYTPQSHSACLPGFPTELMIDLLRRRRTMGNNALIRAFRRAIGSSSHS